MAKTYADQVYQGSVSLTEVIVATISSSQTFIMKGFFVSNNHSDEQHFTLKIGADTRLAANHAISANDTTIRDNLHIPIIAGDSIKLYGDTDMDYYIWGIMETEA